MEPVRAGPDGRDRHRRGMHLRKPARHGRWPQLRRPALVNDGDIDGGQAGVQAGQEISSRRHARLRAPSPTSGPERLVDVMLTLADAK